MESSVFFVMSIVSLRHWVQLNDEVVQSSVFVMIVVSLHHRSHLNDWERAYTTFVLAKP